MARRAQAPHGVEHGIVPAKEHEADVSLFEQQTLRAAGALFGRGRHLRADLAKPTAENVQQLPAVELFSSIFSLARPTPAGNQK